MVERRHVPGGRAGVDELRIAGERWRFDRGAEFIASFYGAARRLLRDAGLDGALVRVPVNGEIVIDGRASPLPATLLALLRSPLLSRASKLRVVALGIRFRARRRPRWASLADAVDLDDRTAADFFAEAVGSDYAQNVLRATLDSLALSPAAETTRVVALAQLVEAPTARLLCPRRGLGMVWDALARDLDVRYGVEAVVVEQAGGTVEIATAGGETLRADSAILAVPAPAAARLLPAGHPDRALAEAARWSPAVKLHLALAEPLPGARPRCPAGPGEHPLAGVIPLESKRTEQVPDGRGGLVICAAPWLGSQLLAKPDGLVRERLLVEAERLLHRPIGGVLGSSVVRMSEGVPLFAVGWLRRLGERRSRRLPVPVDVAGDWLQSPSVEGAVRSGWAAAARALANE